MQSLGRKLETVCLFLVIIRLAERGHLNMRLHYKWQPVTNKQSLFKTVETAVICFKQMTIGRQGDARWLTHAHTHTRIMCCCFVYGKLLGKDTLLRRCMEIITYDTYIYIYIIYNIIYTYIHIYIYIYIHTPTWATTETRAQRPGESVNLPNNVCAICIDNNRFMHDMLCC